MESVDRVRMCLALYPVLRRSRLPRAQIDAVIASSAEGYPFPTNLDRDPPRDGLAPPGQQQLLRRALDEDWPEARFEELLRAHARRRATDGQAPG
jgi:hypothetical protein